MISHSFEEELKTSGRLVCPNLGTSMRPLIRQGKDLMVIVPRSDQRLEKYEAVLFKRGEDYLLHRIHDVCGDEYIMCADGRTNLEKGIKDSQIIGVLHSVLRDGKKEIKVSGFAYKSYVFYWYRIRPILVKIKRKCKRLLRR